MDKNRIGQYLGINRGVLALSIARLADAMGNSILFIIIPLYVAQLPHPAFNLPIPVLVGILISIYGLINSSLQPITGAISDRFGRRKVLIEIGLGLVGLATLCYIFANRYIDLLVLRSVQGVGLALTVPASMALMSVLSRRETRGSSMGVYSTLRMIGFAVGPVVGGFLQVHLGFNAAFYAGAGFVFLAVLLVQLWIKESPNHITNNSKPRFKIFDRSLLSPGILSAGIATFMVANAFSMVTTLENEFNARLNMNAFSFSIAFSGLMIGRLIFQMPLGRLSDSIGRRPLVISGLLLMAPATILLGEATSMLQLTGLRVAQGLASAAVVAPALAVVADLTSAENAGRQMSVVTMGFGLGIALGPLIAGVLVVAFFDLPFIVAGAMSAIGAWVVYKRMPETAKGKSDPKAHQSESTGS
jgi:MFS family permease